MGSGNKKREEGQAATTTKEDEACAEAFMKNFDADTAALDVPEDARSRDAREDIFAKNPEQPFPQPAVEILDRAAAREAAAKTADRPLLRNWGKGIEDDKEHVGGGAERVVEAVHKPFVVAVRKLIETLTHTDNAHTEQLTHQALQYLYAAVDDRIHAVAGRRADVEARGRSLAVLQDNLVPGLRAALRSENELLGKALETRRNDNALELAASLVALGDGWVQEEIARRDEVEKKTAELARIVAERERQAAGVIVNEVTLRELARMEKKCRAELESREKSVEWAQEVVKFCDATSAEVVRPRGLAGFVAKDAYAKVAKKAEAAGAGAPEWLGSFLRLRITTQ